MNIKSVTFTNKGYIDYTHNLLNSIKKFESDVDLRIFTLDEESFNYFGIKILWKGKGLNEIGYDTCPMEGSDTKRVKNILNLPRKAEITMIIGCGVRDEKGIYSPRFRVPFNEVYKRV